MDSLVVAGSFGRPRARVPGREAYYLAKRPVNGEVEGWINVISVNQKTQSIVDYASIGSVKPAEKTIKRESSQWLKNVFPHFVPGKKLRTTNIGEI